jgi:hypothetical protein
METYTQGACILTAENMDTEDDCTTHDHETDDRAFAHRVRALLRAEGVDRL